ncbi:peptidoglycan-binding domain-containing protein [Stackebrandtia nassauensis]|uniref:Peptidoglycan-binding domain 1 protein n=1 Tax=Stackebrandtia nassauensis (strain DSM 44728 / CIP 108903 / NRRL B-16338 / NBRC 102104 / LLR-40K-21) TaxID=446470 RepID=D3PXG2_STANL|nr:peptidoglycan-binding protein [Stackebrandtia nassauensis]ADD41425.1 Peptidoglycan-binding domain 1 protein [Stackebrandtia nassauensis DSM 44728]
MRNRKLKVAVGVGAVALIAGGVAGIAGIAGADPTNKSVEFVDGFGNINDDWNDHEREADVLCEDCDNSSGTDLVVLWQSVLVADGYLASVADIDGEFGADTAEATAEWQGDNELDPTGEVDQATWATADDFLEPGDDGATVSYVGTDEGSVLFTRTDDLDGAYALQSVTNGDGEEVQPESQDDRIWLFDSTISFE